MILAVAPQITSLWYVNLWRLFVDKAWCSRSICRVSNRSNRGASITSWTSLMRIRGSRILSCKVTKGTIQKFEVTVRTDCNLPKISLCSMIRPISSLVSLVAVSYNDLSCFENSPPGKAISPLCIFSVEFLFVKRIRGDVLV